MSLISEESDDILEIDLSESTNLSENGSKKRKNEIFMQLKKKQRNKMK